MEYRSWTANMPRPNQTTQITSITSDDGWGMDDCHQPNGDPCEGGCGGACDPDDD